MHFEYKTESICCRRPTSCADQLAKAVRMAYNEAQNNA